LTMELPTPQSGSEAAVRFVADHLAHLTAEPATNSASVSPIRGGQRAADAALESFVVTGYWSGRNEVFPPERRAASMLSPYIRHGLLPLKRVWDAFADESKDVEKFRDELLWQEYARHWYARLGTRTQRGVRRELPTEAASVGLDRSMLCIDSTLTELESDGWLPNQARLWLSSHWSIRLGLDWRSGEDEFFRHLLDGSRAANRLGWQWSSGVGSNKHYGFSRWQVDKRAPGLCQSCQHRSACPIEDWPSEPSYISTDLPAELKSAADLRDVAGPTEVSKTDNEPDVVWLTAESLASDEPALAAHPELPVVFVFDASLLARLKLSSKRLVFLVETLGELAERRDLRCFLGSPVEILAAHKAAATFAPVPGFRSIAAVVKPDALYPWPWLSRPTDGSVSSFSAWRKHLALSTPTNRAPAEDRHD